MPDITRKGVTLNEAFQEAAAIAPVRVPILAAYELYHPTMSVPLRFVNDKADLVATIEGGAPRNAGTDVTFVACPLSFEAPEESDNAQSPTMKLSRPDVASILSAALKAARDSLEPWELIERVYASENTSVPAILPPLKLEVPTFTLSGAAGQFEAQFDDDATFGIPRITFHRNQYPGLKR